ncbi:M48 family metalloprotease [Roseateles koreensis]|uniref:M48 family metalloprotease n=1 Tax=Roseateles koreensis TaxID=2987526 RepID=A0ABT5KPL6_9BURK|nr:M48 family metalloprotease [Roseateles koreensis]MDC8784385.1 M48 family metalloprotease [Roseateles koreensis]
MTRNARQMLNDGPHLRQRVWALPIAVALLGIVPAYAIAQAQTLGTQETPEAASAPSTAASSPGESVLGAIGSFFNRFKPGPADAKAPDTAASAAEPSERNAEKPRNEGFNIIDIESWSRTSDVVLDPQCKTMVQPFGIGDNAASLAVLAAKLKLSAFLEQLQGQNKKPMAINDIVKLAARHLNWLPMEAELALGQQMLNDGDVLDENKNKDSQRTYAEARAMLADIVKDLPKPLPYDFQVKVLTKSYGNASALPGGIVQVDRDLFKKGADRDFAYFVMAHEVAHVLQRHETRVYQARLADGIDSIDGLRKLMSNAATHNPATLVAYASSLKRLFVNFTEAQELQADSCAIRLTAQRYPDKKVWAATLKKIETRLGPITPETPEGPQGNTLIDHLKYVGDGIMERHPNTGKRRGNMELTFNITTLTTPAPGAVVR